MEIIAHNSLTLFYLMMRLIEQFLCRSFELQVLDKVLYTQYLTTVRECNSISTVFRVDYSFPIGLKNELEYLVLHNKVLHGHLESLIGQISKTQITRHQRKKIPKTEFSGLNTVLGNWQGLGG